MDIEIDKTKEKIIALLKSTQRSNIEDLIQYLDANHFFTLPASLNYHANVRGGLAHHCLLTAILLYKRIREYKELQSKVNSAVICGVLHDVCKVDLYEEIVAEQDAPTEKQVGYLHKLCRERNMSVDPSWVLCRHNCSQMLSFLKGELEKPDLKTGSDIVYRKREGRTLHLGHAEHSIFTVSHYIKLTDEEASTIRWHMSCHDLGSYGEKSYADAKSLYPLVTFLQLADGEASCIETFDLTSLELEV